MPNWARLPGENPLGYQCCTNDFNPNFNVIKISFKGSTYMVLKYDSLVPQKVVNFSGFLYNRYISEEATEIAFFCNISGFRMVTQTIWKPLKFPTNLESCQKVPILKGSEYQ